MSLKNFFKSRWIRYYSGAPEAFLSGTSGSYIEDMYNAWKENPKKVHASWDAYFRSEARGRGYQRPPTLGQDRPNEYPLTSLGAEASQGTMSEAALESEVMLHFGVQLLIRSYQVRGHLVADLDPLRIKFGNHSLFYDRQGKPDVKVVRSYLTENWENEINRTYYIPKTTFIKRENEKKLSLKEIIKRLEEVYCQTLGAEFMYLESVAAIDWIKENLETPGIMTIPKETKRLLLKRLIRSSEFENFLAKKWTSEKRFGLEGCDILIPAMKTIMDRSSEHGVEVFIMGMPHRGRLNVLANVCRKPLEQIFTQFAGLDPEDEGSGDVKYHLGTYVEKLNTQTNKTVKISICANPSHLEAVNPIVHGKCRAEQFYRGDHEGKKVMSILIHGDAAFAGQGVVFESFHLTNLPMYTNRGTIHVVVNNQIGFTTDPRFSRSSAYCTDVARVVEAPIFHVNADDPERVVYVCQLAADYRARYQKDVVIDLVCYRRNGHNEIDEPMFTQPLMYKKIRARKTILELYSEKLLKEGTMTAEEIDSYRNEYEKICEKGFEAAKGIKNIRHMDWLDSPWSGFFGGRNLLEKKPTGINEKIINHIGNVFASPPPASMEFVLHKGIERILAARKKMLEEKMVDWAMAEALAFGSLLKEGIHVRLSGQDVERGTFSHRHHILHHQNLDMTTYSPLSHVYPDQAVYDVCNSSLSEYAVLGFELGYSITSPNALVIWEAQFGDFNNTAQCIIDQFISSGQTKWGRQTGLVMLQPHGMEGMGPEHSSARLERFLQMSEEDEDIFPRVEPGSDVKQIYNCNWIIVNLTTPANYFHVLRRQIYLNFRKPLVVMSPKSLLRHPEVKSHFSEMTENTEFQRMIFEDGPASREPIKVKRLIFCSGKVYYDLTSQRREKKMELEVAISRLEQISPFPFDLVKEETERYPNAELVWVQEEHKNHGAWGFIQQRFHTATGGSRPIAYVGRRVSASPATGSKALHHKELAFIEEAFKL